MATTNDDMATVDNPMPPCSGGNDRYAGIHRLSPHHANIVAAFINVNDAVTVHNPRIASSRPGTDGKFTFRNLPAGDYRLTAVTDVEPGEWFDPAFLGQLMNASIPVSLKEGDKITQDIKVAGGGH